MRLSKDAWLDWYKDRRIEESVAHLASLLKETNTERILDFGSGTGRHTTYLAKMGFEVYGFDWSQAATRAAKQELSKQGPSANHMIWDMNETPPLYDDSFFDAVIVVRVLHHTYGDKISRIESEFNLAIARITLFPVLSTSLGFLVLSLFVD